MEKIRWGLLSTAGINRRVIPAIEQSERGELTAVASRAPEAAAAYAAEWGIPQSYGSYEAILQADDVDALYISLPNHLHAEWTIKALDAGKHVLCEKPFALTLTDVDLMLAAAERSGMVLAEAFMYRHHPQMKLAGQLVQDGRLGDVTLVKATFNYQAESRQNIRLVPEYGGGCLWDVGVYPVSLAQYIMGGPPERVSGSQIIGDTGVDEFFAGQLLYADGRAAQINSSFMMPFETTVEIMGTKGKLWLTRPFVGSEEGTMHLQLAGEASQTLPVADDYLYLGEIDDMQAAILDGQPIYLTLNETRGHVQTVLALYEAAASGEDVRL